MQDADLFLEVAGIAGVFVGFGALIAARSSGPSEALEIAPMRAVVALGVMAIIAAITPVTLGRFGPTGHELWGPSSLVVLVSWLVMFAISFRTPEYRQGWATMSAARPGGVRATDLIGGATYLVYMIAALVTPIVILLGLAPDLEAALYFLAVVLILIGAAWSLMWLVYMERRPAVP